MSENHINLGDFLKDTPAVLSNNAAPQMSKYYNQIPTHELVSWFQKKGWEPNRVMQTKVRKNAEERQHFVKHHVILENSKLAMIDGCKTRLILTNDHEGKSALRLAYGLLRLICTNGLVVFSNIIPDIRIRHDTLNMAGVLDAIDAFETRIPMLVDKQREWVDVQLAPERQFEFAQNAVQIRWPNPLVGAPLAVNPRFLNAPRRRTDEGNSLWMTYNRVQENLIKGGYQNTEGRRVPAIRGSDADVKINRGLWNLAEQYALPV